MNAPHILCNDWNEDEFTFYLYKCGRVIKMFEFFIKIIYCIIIQFLKLTANNNIGILII